MADTEAFDIIAQLKREAEALGGRVSDSVLTFDAALPEAVEAVSSFVWASRHIIVFSFAGLPEISAFLRGAKGPLETLLERSSAVLSVKWEKGPLTINLKIGVEAAQKEVERAETQMEQDD